MRYIYGCIVLYVCRAAHSPVTSPKASGKAGIIMEARPSQQCLTLDFNTAVANKGPSQLLVPAITGSRGKLLSFISGDHSYSEAGTHFPVLGYLQHDSLDDTVDKNLTVLGSQGWFHPWGPSELNDSSGSSKHRAATTTSMPWHLTASASTGRAGTAEITPTMGSACYSQGKQRVNPDPNIFCCCCWKQLQCKLYYKTTVVTVWAGQNWSWGLLSLSFSGIRME